MDDIGWERDFRHHTSDLWEAAYLWAAGYTPSHTEVDDRERVTFHWPAMGPRILDDVRSYRAGTAVANAHSMKQGYYHARSLLRSGSHDADAP